MYQIIVLGSGDYTLKLIKAVEKNPCMSVVGVCPNPYDRKGEFADAILKDGRKILSMEEVKLSDVDLVFSSEYFRLVPADIVSEKLCINLHGGILPKYRGLSSNAYAIMHGEEEVGFTLHRTEEGLDTGAIYHIFKTPIAYEQTYSDVNAILKDMVLKELSDLLVRIIKDEIIPIPNEGEHIYTNRIHREDGIIKDFNVASIDIYNRFRCFAPPLGTGLQFYYHKKLYTAYKWSEEKNKSIKNVDKKIKPGEIVAISQLGLYVKVMDNFVRIQDIHDDEGKSVLYECFAVGDMCM